MKRTGEHRSDDGWRFRYARRFRQIERRRCVICGSRTRRTEHPHCEHRHCRAIYELNWRRGIACMPDVGDPLAGLRATVRFLDFILSAKSVMGREFGKRYAHRRPS